MSETSPPVDHYLIAGQVAFLPVGDNQTPQAMALNTLLKMPAEHKMNAKAIGLAQQSLQMQVHRRVGSEAPPKMLDVCILTIIFLGSFVEGEFEAGSILQENLNEQPS
jgi:hypothetical protein